MNIRTLTGFFSIFTFLVTLSLHSSEGYNENRLRQEACKWWIEHKNDNTPITLNDAIRYVPFLSYQDFKHVKSEFDRIINGNNPPSNNGDNNTTVISHFLTLTENGFKEQIQSMYWSGFTALISLLSTAVFAIDAYHEKDNEQKIVRGLTAVASSLIMLHNFREFFNNLYKIHLEV